MSASARALPASPSSPDRRRLRQDLRQAAQQGGFSLLFQPRRALGGATRPGQGALLGAEAQLRWPRRGGGVTPAGALMPLLEAQGLAETVVHWALLEACRAAVLWPSGLLSVVVPGTLLTDGTLLGHVGAALAGSGLDPERLEISLPEAALADDAEAALLTLAALRDLGIGVALDGFGAGSAGLLPLRRLPLTGIKLDRALVRDITLDTGTVALVRAATALAHALDIAVVACGLETPAQCDLLRAAGCDSAQGSLCGRVVGETGHAGGRQN